MNPFLFRSFCEAGLHRINRAPRYSLNDGAGCQAIHVLPKKVLGHRKGLLNCHIQLCLQPLCCIARKIGKGLDLRLDRVG